MIEKRGRSERYNNVDFSYSVYGENKQNTGEAWIHLYFGDASQNIQLVLNVNFDTLDEAEDAIIKSAKCWIDNKRQ